jgi:cytochrome c oxidase assembly factor CtaG
LTFSKVLWYAAYAGTTGAFGLTPLQDQQLGGAIMWVPLGVVFIVVALALMARWISESDRRLKFGSVAALLEKERQRVPAENGVESL